MYGLVPLGQTGLNKLCRLDKKPHNRDSDYGLHCSSLSYTHQQVVIDFFENFRTSMVNSYVSQYFV